MAHHGHKAHHHGKHHKASGGRTHMVVSGNPDVIKEAEGKESYAKGDEKPGDARKHGGKVKHHGKHHRKHGGHVEHHPDGHEMHGHHAHHRADHKPRGRKRGGGVGADRSPLSTAHHGHAGAGHGSSEPKDTYGGTPP